MRDLRLPALSPSGIIIVVVVAVLVVACGSNDVNNGPAPPRPEEQELVYSALREPDTLNPLLADTEEAIYFSELVFDGLVNRTLINRKGEALYSEALCKRYREQSRQNRYEITMELDLGATWHNGVPFTADDVVFTWQALHDSDSPLVGWLDSLVEKIYKVDDDELHITLKVERSEEALNEIFSTFKIIPRVYDPAQGDAGTLPADLRLESGIVNDFNYRPVGTGPFRVVDRAGSRITLERNESYFQGPPRLPRLRMQRLEAPEVAVSALIDEELHLIFDVQPRFHQQLQDASVRSLEYTPYGFHAIAYNVRKPPFNSARFRKAANLATEKSLLFSVFTGLREPDEYLNTGVYPHNFEFVRKDPDAFPEVYGYSIRRARASVSGHSSQARQFKLTISTELQGTNAKRLAQAYSEMMKEAGITVEIDDLNMLSYDRALRERSFQAAFVHFSGLNHLYNFRELFGEDNLFGLRDAELRRLLNSYAQTLTWVDLEGLSKQIHARVAELAPACFLFTPPRRAFMADDLAKVSIHPEVGFATAESWEFE